MEDDQRAHYLANIYFLVRADGSVDRLEEKLFERIAKDIGATHPTMVMGEGKLCDMPHCDGFEFIKCE